MPPKLTINTSPNPKGVVGAAPAPSPFLSINGATSKPAPAPSFGERVGSFLFGNPVARAVATAIQEPAAQKSFDMQNALRLGWDTITSTIEDSAKRFQNLAENWHPVSHPGSTAIATGEAAMGVINDAFLGITAPLESARGIPGIGYAADALHNVFAAIGAGSSEAAYSGIDAIPDSVLSPAQKAKVKPLAGEVASLVAMIATGKVAGDAGAEAVSKTHEMLNEINSGLQGAKAVVESKYRPSVPVTELPSEGAPNVRRIGDIQMGPEAKPTADTLPVISHDTPPAVYTPRTADFADQYAALSPKDRASVLSETRTLFGRGMDWQTARDVAIGRFETRQAGPEARIVPETPRTPGLPPKMAVNAPEGAPAAPEAVLPPETPPSRTRSGLLKEVKGTGEVKTRGVAATLEAKAIENGLTTRFADLPEYRTLNMKDQAAKVQDYMDTNWEDAIRVARGEKTPPPGVTTAGMLVGVEDRAIRNGDFATIEALARGRAPGEIGTMAQNLRSLAERDPASPVTALESISQARETNLTKKGGEVETQTDQLIKTEGLKETAKKISRPSWDEFIKSITCPS